MIRSIIIPTCAISLIALGQASAAVPLEDQLSACMSIPTDQARLTCFETIAQNTKTTEAPATALKQIESKEVKQRRRFGLTRTPRPVRREQDFGARAPEDTGITTISAQITDVKLAFKTANRIELDNGQIWQQLSSDSTRVKTFRSNTTYTATIKKAALGSFRMTIEPMGRTIRVKRLK